jgi:hypothetical protein
MKRLDERTANMKLKCQSNWSQAARVNMLAALVAALFLLPGCRHASYMTYQGTGPMQGTGGTVRSMDGIEIWENGTPNRRYTILGVSDQQRSGRHDKSDDEELCKLAQKHGGNAIIMLTENQGQKAVVKAQIIRYAP